MSEKKDFLREWQENRLPLPLETVENFEDGRGLTNPAAGT